MQDTGLRSDLISTFVLLRLFQEGKADQRPAPELVRGVGAGLASHWGSETGGHSHGTRTHQQVLVIGAILRLRVMGGKGQGGAGGEREERGDTDERG